MIDQGVHTGLRIEGCLVIRDADAWNEFWARHVSDRLPPPTPPSVDWDRQMVLAVVDRERSSGGFAVSIARVERDANDELACVARFTAPGDGATTTVMTRPYAFVAVPREDAVEFIRE